MTRDKRASVPARIGLTLLGVVQIAFALAAFSDLWARPDKQVRGAKPAWIPVILVNWIGPAAYFLIGVKKR
ncbi:PLDc N-terminal domain-containing protein [Microbacterium album]|nr:PLDc N-terminal domain-containing protein [Microbacterium album]